MCLFADRTIGHRARFEARYDRFDWFNFTERNRITTVLESHQSPQRAKISRLIINQLAELFESVVVVGTAGMLQLVNCLVIEKMILALAPVTILSAKVETGFCKRAGREPALMPQPSFLGDHVQTNAADP